MSNDEEKDIEQPQEPKEPAKDEPSIVDVLKALDTLQKDVAELKAKQQDKESDEYEEEKFGF